MLCSFGNLDSIKIHCKDKNESEYIFYAAMNGHLEVVKYFLSEGFDITSGAIAIASENGHLPVVKYLRENNAPIDSMALMNALVEPHVDIVKYLLNSGAPIHYQTVYWAARYDIELAKYLMWNIYEPVQQLEPRIKELLAQEIIPILSEFLGDLGEIVFEYCICEQNNHL